MSNHKFIYEKETIELVTVAKEYLVLLENIEQLEKQDFIERSLKIVSLLYLKGLCLSSPDYFEEEDVEKFVDELHWSFFQNKISQLLEEDDIFIQLQDSNIVSDMDYINVSLSEVYADLYQEFGNLIAAYRTENEEIMLATLYCCYENFSTYWGIRALLLLKNLHTIKYNFNSNELF